MKEFGLYTIKQKYINEFQAADSSLANPAAKWTSRPFICIKLGGHNWLVPSESINPKNPNFAKKRAKVLHFIKLDKAEKACTIEIVKDISGVQNDPNYQSVITYYHTLPVKHKYCKKFRDKNKRHIVVDTNLGKSIKGKLINYLSDAQKGAFSGFIKHMIEKGNVNFYNYPTKIILIHRSLYLNHLKLLYTNKKTAAEKEEQYKLNQRKRNLATEYKNKHK